MKRLGYMRRVPESSLKTLDENRAAKALASAIFGVPARRIIIGEAHGIVGLLFPNMLEVFGEI